MSANCYDYYYNYLQYIKNAKVPPIYLNQNGYVFATAPLDFSNNIMSLRVQSPIIIDNYNLALDLSANYHFTGPDSFRVDASNVYLTNLRDGSNGHSNIVVYDASTGRLSYTSTGGGTGITQVLSGTNIDVMFGSTIPVVNLEISSPVDCCGQSLYDVSSVDFLSEINIRDNLGTQYIYTVSGDTTLYLNGTAVSTNDIYSNDIYANNIYAIDISAQDIYSQGIYTNTLTTNSLTIQDISTIDISAQQLTAPTIYTNTILPSSGSTITIGDLTSTINIYGTVNKIETTNVEITDQLITLNKNGTNATSLGSGFEIEASGGIVGYIKTDSTDGSSFLVKVPASPTVYKMVLADASGYIDISGISGAVHIGGAFDVSGNTVLNGKLDVSGATVLSGATHIGSTFDVSGTASIVGNTVLSGTLDVSGATVLTGNTHIGGAFDVSGNTILSGKLDVSGATVLTGNTHIGGAFDVSGTTTLSGTTNVNSTANFGSTTNFNSTANFNSNILFTSLTNVNKTTLLNIDPITDIVSYETHPTYTSPLSSDASNVISIPKASATTNGYLASGDWTTFNTLLSNISATAPLTFINNVINLSNVDLSGTNGYLSSAQYQTITNSIAVAGGTAIAQVYYVAMNGNDASGTGSVMSPFATIQKAINLCTDAAKYYTIYVAPYAYTESPTIGASISPRISIIGLTNNTNSKTVTITGTFTIAAITATGNETNNVIAFKNLTIQAPTGNAINLTGQGFSLFVNNTNIAVTGTNTSSVLNLASTSRTTRYYFDNVRLNNVAVASTNHMVNLVAGQIWSITNSDFTNANTGGSVIYSYDNSGQLLAVANSSFTNTIYGNVFTIQANPSSCSLTNTTLIGYNTDASAGLLVLGNGVAAGSGGNFSVSNSILYNTNSATSANTYVFLNGGATFISSANSFYSPNVGVTAFTPFGFKATKTNNIVRFTNSAYFSGNVAGTNTVTYPSLSAGIIVVENMLNDTNNLTNFNNASIKFNALPLTATDASLVTFNPTTKQIGYRSIPTASAGSNIGIVTTSGSPTISVAITSTLDLSNQGIIGISYERFAGQLNIQNSTQVPIIYTTTNNLLLNPSGGVINTTSHNIDLSNASLVGISSEIFNTNMNIQVSGVATPIIYTTGTATDIILNPNGGVVSTNAHNIDLVNASIVNVNTITGKSSSNLTLDAGNGGNHMLFKTGNTPITRMEMDTTKISMYLPLDMSNNYITNASYLNFGNSNGGISIQQNDVPRIYTQANNLIIDPSTNGALQFGGAHTFDLCGGRIATATSLTGVADTSLSIQYLGATSGALYLQSATNPTTNKRMVLDNSGIHVSGTGIFDISGITSNIVIDASGNLNMDGGSSTYKFKVAGQTGNMYVGGTADISGVTTIALNGNKLVVDTTGTHSSGGILDASGSVYKNTLSDASGNVYINGITQFANSVDICSNTIKMNLPDGSGYTYYVSYDISNNTKQLGYKKNVTASSPLVLDGNNNLTYDFTQNATYNNATTQINSTSLIGLSGGIVDICGSTALNLYSNTITMNGATNMNGNITSSGSNTWSGTNYYTGDISINNTTTFIRSTSIIGLSSDIIDISAVTALNISGPTTINGATTMNGNLTSAAAARNVWNGTNYYAGDVSFNAGAYFRNATVSMSALPQSTQNNVVNINTATGALSYDTSYNVAKAILSTANTWSQTQTFGSNIYMNSNNIYLQNNTNFTIGMYDLSHVGLGYNGVYNFNYDNQGNTGIAGSGTLYVANTGGLVMGNAVSPYISMTQTTLDFYASGGGNNYIKWDSGTNSLAVSGYNGGFLQGTNGGAKKALIWDNNYNVGINTTPSYHLDVYDASDSANYVISKFFSNANSSGVSNTFINVEKGGGFGGCYGGFISQGVGSGAVIYGINGGARSTNNIVVADYQVQITCTNGGLYVSNLGTGAVYSNSGVLSNTGPSDPSLKKNIIQVTDVSANFELLNPVQFEWIDPNMGQGVKYGFLANEMNELFPNIVSTWKDASGNDKLGYDPVSLIPIMISYIKQQTTKISQQSATISQQATAISNQNDSISTLQTQMSSMMSDMATLKQMFNL